MPDEPNEPAQDKPRPPDPLRGELSDFRRVVEAAGKLDLLGFVEPIGDFEQLAKHAETHPIGALHVKVISLDDLICVKQHIKRVKDRESLMQLLAIKRIREENSDVRRDNT
jgi:predicted nucleotidyltransferase